MDLNLLDNKDKLKTFDALLMLRWIKGNITEFAKRVLILTNLPKAY